MGKQTKGIAFSGVMAAGAFAVLALGRIFPTGQMGFAALASLFVAAAVIDCGKAWGLSVWAISSMLGLTLLGGSSASWMFALFFGYYPAVKLLCEKKLSKTACWIVKIAVFYAGAALSLSVIGVIAGYIGSYGLWIIPAAAVVGAVVFMVFDIGYSRLIGFYRTRISRR